jgi:hypothetical protein
MEPHPDEDEPPPAGMPFNHASTMVASPVEPPQHNQVANNSLEEEPGSGLFPYGSMQDTNNDQTETFLFPDHSYNEDCFDDEEGDLPMYEMESSLSCADDYEPFIGSPSHTGSEPLPIRALLDWYKEHIATGYSELAISPKLECKIQLLVLLTKVNAPLYMYSQILK